jgi:hypothetical protein
MEDIHAGAGGESVAVDAERVANEVLYDVGDRVFDVEKVLAYRPEDDHYYIKWRGYPESENTWEPKGILPGNLVSSWMYSSASLDSSLYENQTEEVNATKPDSLDDVAFGALVLKAAGLAVALMVPSWLAIMVYQSVAKWTTPAPISILPRLALHYRLSEGSCTNLPV